MVRLFNLIRDGVLVVDLRLRALCWVVWVICNRIYKDKVNTFEAILGKYSESWGLDVFQNKFSLVNFWLDNKILLIEYNDVRASFCLFPKTMLFDQDVKYISLDVNFGNEEFQNLKASVHRIFIYLIFYILIFSHYLSFTLSYVVRVVIRTNSDGSA